MTNQLSIPTENVQVFQFHSQEVRTEIIDHEIWFCLADVTNVLGIKRGTHTAERLNPKGVRKTSTLTDGGQQELLFINESNLYKLIFRSNKAEARAFEDYVTGKILPTIRKTGSYSVDPQQLKLDAPITDTQRKHISTSVFIWSSCSHFTRRECWQMLHTKFNISSVREITAAQYDTVTSWLDEGVREASNPLPKYEASPELEALETELDALFNQFGWDAAYAEINNKRNPLTVAMGLSSIIDDSLKLARRHEKVMVDIKRFEVNFLKLKLIQSAMM